MNNFDTLIGSYHLVTYLENGQNYVHLVKIVFPNKLKFYTLPNAFKKDNYSQYSCLLDKLPVIKINNFGDFIYSDIVISQYRNLLDVNNDMIKLISVYEIKIIGTPIIINNKYNQEIRFTTNKIIDVNKYNQIYIDYTSSISYFFIQQTNGKYYIVSDNYLSNNFNVIYTIYTNYYTYINREQSLNTSLNISDTTILSDYIQTTNISSDILVQDIILSNIDNTNIYDYKLLDNTNNINLNINETYKINSFVYNIIEINNNDNTLNTQKPIDNDILQSSNISTEINLYIINKLDTDYIIDTSVLFPNVKQLKILLLNNSKIKDYTLYNYLKSWSSWSLLNSINKVSSLETLVNLGYINSSGDISDTPKNNINFSYLTNDDVKMLSEFIKSINSSDINKENFFTTQEIEIVIYNNLYYWLNNPNFFMNTLQNINDFLISNDYQVSFNGTNIIFDNDPDPDLILINGTYEIAGYITDEFTYDETNNIVYRSVNNYNKINSQISNWINKVNNSTDIHFGVNIHKLLRYLVTLGTELVNLINTFSDTLTDDYQYVFNNPLKFLINKIWGNNFNSDETIKNLNYNFNSELQYSITFENTNNRFTSLTEYLPDLSILNFGLYSINYYNIYNSNNESNMIKIELNEPSSSIPTKNTIKLVINPIFPYAITFNSNIIKSNCTYSIDFLNGDNITNDIVIIDPMVYPGQINFYSEYDIKSSDFITVKQNTNFTIKNTTINGHLYNITFSNVNYQYIDSIIYNNVQLTILTINTNSLDILIPFESNELQTTELLEIHNISAIKNITTLNSNQYLEFYSYKFNFIANNTLLKTSANLYTLYKDTNNLYYVTGIPIDSMDVSIITLLTPLTITNLNQISYTYELNEDIDTDIYNPSYFEFSIINSIDQNIIIPINVNIIDTTNIVFYYNVDDYKTISYYSYYFNYIIPSTISTIIYLYKPLLDAIPLIDTENKSSSYFNQINGKTYFNNLNLYDTFQLNNSITFIQENSWNIINFRIVALTIIFIKPTDFILNKTSKYSYKINNISVPNTNIIINNNEITITLSTPFTGTTLVFYQYYIETDYIVLFNSTQSNYNTITYSERLGEKFINQITKIEKISEYLYNFNFIIPSTTDTVIYVYNKNIDNIYNTYEPEINPNSKISIYFNQSTNQTEFTTSILYTDLQLSDNILFVQKNSWTIIDFTVNGTSISFVVPTDFVLNTTSKYYYKINNIKVDSSKFIFESGIIIIKLNIIFTGTTIIFKQYYIETDNSSLLSPILNTSFKITYNLPYQYTIDDNFYMIPYTSNRTEYDEYLYIINTGASTTSSEFMGKYNNSNYSIILYNNGNEYNGKIFDEYDNTFIYYIISLKEMINTSYTYTYSLNDNIIRTITGIQFYQDSLQYAKFYKQDSQNYIYLFMNNLVNNYLINNPPIVSNYSKFYLVSYDQYTLINLYDPNKFVQNSQMTRKYQSETSTTSTPEEPIFNDYSKLFNSYSLYFNDQLLEEINEDVINLNRYLYSNENQKQQLDKMTKIRFNGISWEIYMPLIFWFCNKPGLAIPSVALPHTDIILKYKLNDLKTFLSNDLSGTYSLTVTPDVKITLITEFVLLDMIERTLFGSYSHEYVIDRYKIYPNLFVNSQSMEAHRFFTGLVKDIHLISKPLNSNLTYYTQEIPKYDYKYGEYITALEYYNLFIVNNVYTSQDQVNYAKDIEIIKNNMAELNIYYTTDVGDRIIRLIENFGESLLKYFMYYEDKYLSQLSSTKRNDVLNIYLKFQYSDKVLINEISPLTTLSIRVNGSEIFAARDNIYYNNVIPYSKFKNSPPTGYYSYTFSLYPLEDQHSGHLNFTNFDDITFIINSDSNVNSNPYLLNTIIKEYNILRVMSGIGSLAWIS